MDNNAPVSSASELSVTVPPPAAPAPVVPPPAAPAPATPVPRAAAGAVASSGNPVTAFFDGIKLIDIVVIGLSVTAFLFIIKHYRGQIKLAKNTYPQLQKDMEEVKANVQSAMGEQYQAF